MIMKLFIFGGFSHDAKGVLAGIQRRTLVFIELFLQIGLGCSLTLERIHRGIEIPGAIGTNGNGGSTSKPFDHADSAFRHESSFTYCRWLGYACGN